MSNEIHERAVKIYNETRPSEQVLAMYGTSYLTPIQRATLSEIESHLQNVANATAEFGVKLDAAKIEFPATRETARAAAEQKAACMRRTAGARALVRKYGAQGASDIVARKTGKRINFQH
jgi:hypothetical protein